MLLDRHYAQAPWLLATADLKIDQLIRARCDQVLYRAAPPRTGKRGAPCKDRPRFKGSDPSTHGAPAATWSGQDARGQPIEVRCWTGLHSRKARAVPLTASQIVRPQAPDSKRDRREAWFWWRGAALPPLDELVTYYPRRFSQEHGYRFDKQNLLWDAPKLQTPEQLQRWTDVVRNELVLARNWVVAERRPWERRRLIITPRQVRRAMGRFIGQLGTPAPPPQLRGKAPGRAHGAHVKRAERHAVVRKTPPHAKKRRKRGTRASPIAPAG